MYQMFHIVLTFAPLNLTVGQIVAVILGLAGFIGAVTAILGTVNKAVQAYHKKDRDRLEALEKSVKEQGEFQKKYWEAFNKHVQIRERLDTITLRYDILSNMRRASKQGYKDELLVSETSRLLEIYQGHYHGNHITVEAFNEYAKLPTYKQWLASQKEQQRQQINQQIDKKLGEQ